MKWICLLALMMAVWQVNSSVMEEISPLTEESFDDEDDVSSDVGAVMENIDPLSLIRRTWKLQPVLHLEDDNNEDVLNKLCSPVVPVHFAILFVARSERCHMLAQEFAQLAKAHWSDLERKRSVSTSPLYFFQVNVSRSPQFFRDHKVSKAPHLVVLPKGSLFSKHDALDRAAFDPHTSLGWTRWPSWLSEQTSLSFSSSSVAGSSTSGGGGIMSPEVLEQLEKFGKLLILLQLGGIAVSNYQRWGEKHIWLGVSLLAYTLSISGLIFSFLRGMPPIGYNQQYGLMFFYPDRSNQFILEGLLVGLLNLSVSAMLVMAARGANGEDVVERVENWLNADLTPRPRNWTEGLKQAKWGLSTALLLFLALLVCFKRKAPWYSPLWWG